MRLAEAKSGARVVVTAIESEEVQLQALRFGIEAGSHVVIETNIPGGPVVVRRNQQEIAIGRSLAQSIACALSVEPVLAWQSDCPVCGLSSWFDQRPISGYTCQRCNHYVEVSSTCASTCLSCSKSGTSADNTVSSCSQVAAQSDKPAARTACTGGFWRRLLSLLGR